MSARFVAAIWLSFVTVVWSTTPVIPEWARPQWETFARSHTLTFSTRITPVMLQGDFDGDGRIDIALFVENTKNHKQGIVFLHQSGAGPIVVGAGTPLGNGGDDFEWMDSWAVKRRSAKLRTDAVLLMRESSASGLVYFEGGHYRWKQQGD